MPNFILSEFLSYVFSSGMDPVKGLDDYITSKGYSTEDTEAFSQAKRDFYYWFINYDKEELLEAKVNFIKTLSFFSDIKILNISVNSGAGKGDLASCKFINDRFTPEIVKVEDTTETEFTKIFSQLGPIIEESRRNKVEN